MAATPRFQSFFADEAATGDFSVPAGLDAAFSVEAGVSAAGACEESTDDSEELPLQVPLPDVPRELRLA
jgi:hypothetical protein